MTQLSLDTQAISGDTLGEEEKGESHLSREMVEVRSMPLEGEVSITGRPWAGQGGIGQVMSTCWEGGKNPVSRWKKDALLLGSSCSGGCSNDRSDEGVSAEPLASSALPSWIPSSSSSKLKA